MSRAQIIAVCELSAHLAQQTMTPERDELGHVFDGFVGDPPQCASDAMLLQKLGARATRALDKRSACEAGRAPHDYSQEELEDEWERVTDQANAVLSPYGLKAECRDEPFSAECLFIVGLPSNSADGTDGGFSI